MPFEESDYLHVEGISEKKGQKLTNDERTEAVDWILMKADEGRAAKSEMLLCGGDSSDLAGREEADVLCLSFAENWMAEQLVQFAKAPRPSQGLSVAKVTEHCCS